MKMVKSGLFLLTLFSAVTYAANNGIPVGPHDDTLPVPVGNIPYFKMPNALAADKNEYTWDYCGTLKNAVQSFSFQATIAQFFSNGQIGLGFHLFDFGFAGAQHLYFSDSTYGGEKKSTNAALHSLDWVTSQASLEKLSISATSLFNSTQQWSITSLGRTPRAPIFRGWVGQPGQEYELNGVGKTYLWRYNAKTGTAKIAPYTYSFSVTVMDERGVTMEGLGGGYVGPALIPGKMYRNGYAVESEIAQPRLRVLSWNISFQAAGAVKTGYQANYSFGGNAGMLWNDIGPVDKAGLFQNPKTISGLIQKILPTDANQILGSIHQKINAMNHHQTSGLYDGNWIPVEFTRGKYAGATLVFSAFWRKNEEYPKHQSTSDLSWSKIGWCNFYSGLIPNEIDSASSLLETLYPENPLLPSANTTEVPPYDITINRYVPKQFGMAFPWAQKVTITIKANTALRYALAAYADELAKNNNADDPTKNLTITVRAISPVTQNTLFSSAVTQYYEGAAVPTMNGKKVGYAWIEHMVK